MSNEHQPAGDWRYVYLGAIDHNGCARCVSVRKRGVLVTETATLVQDLTRFGSTKRHGFTLLHQAPPGVTTCPDPLSVVCSRCGAGVDQLCRGLKSRAMLPRSKAHRWRKQTARATFEMLTHRSARHD